MFSYSAHTGDRGNGRRLMTNILMTNVDEDYQCRLVIDWVITHIEHKI